MTPELVLRVLNAAQDITHRRGHPPEVIRCHPRVAIDLAHATAETVGAYDLGRFGPPGATIPDYFDTRPPLAGMPIEDDPYLPAHVWRLCDTDATLLYDCREGTPAL